MKEAEKNETISNLDFKNLLTFINKLNSVRTQSWLCGTLLLLIFKHSWMSYHSLTDLRPSDRTTYPPVEKTFYEVTFLGTVCLVYLNQENVCNISRVERIKNLVRKVALSVDGGSLWNPTQSYWCHFSTRCPIWQKCNERWWSHLWEIFPGPH